MSHKEWKNLNPFELHRTLMKEYLSTSSSLKTHRSNFKTDFDIIKENHKFLWDEKDEKNIDTWEKRLAKKYYDKLYREYCIADLSRYKENKFGLRWRTEDELISGRGQFNCGNKKCTEKEALRTWEVNFAYQEHGQKKNALVKLRLCPRCSDKLNYTYKRKEVKRLKKRLKEKEIPSRSKRTSPEKDNIDNVNEEEVTEDPQPESSEKLETDIWKAQDTSKDDKSRDEEFEEYLQDLFL